MNPLTWVFPFGANAGRAVALGVREGLRHLAPGSLETHGLRHRGRQRRWRAPFPAFAHARLLDDAHDGGALVGALVEADHDDVRHDVGEHDGELGAEDQVRLLDARERGKDAQLEGTSRLK